MPSLPGAYENCGSDPFSRRHSKDSGLSGSSVARSARGACCLRPHSADGLVLKVVITTQQAGSVCLAMADLALNPPEIFVLNPPSARNSCLKAARPPVAPLQLT